ncbi:MAG: hypothetical protein HOW73_42450 [Polyangiaceae bacterium]|nr:hypothetical protein [Polyangiaceae bacterium]
MKSVGSGGSFGVGLRTVMAIGFLGASGALLAAACETSTTEPVTPTAGTSTAKPATKCSHSRVSNANLAATSRIRDLVNKRRKVGIVPVKVTVTDDCQLDIEVLDQCNAAGFYDYQPYSGRHRTQIRKADDVNAELPIREEDFGRKLDGGQIVVSDEEYIGKYETTSSDLIRKQDLKGIRCIEATHYISKIYVGGFAMAAGPSAELDKMNSVFYERSRFVFAQEGNPKSCQEAAPNARQATELCSVPLKIELSDFQTGQAETGECAHDPCEAGDKLDKKCNTCVEAVCNAVSYCCSSHWDSGCINKAKQICPQPCTNCAHKLCENGEKLEATCNPCVQKICAQDSYCCNNTWDQSCIGKVPSVCGLSKDELAKQGCQNVQPLCSGGQFWDGSKCTCPTGTTWDGATCYAPPPPPSCHDVCTVGAPQMTSCDSCAAKICAQDPFCCNTNWDLSCTQKVKSVCKKACPFDKPIGGGGGTACKPKGSACKANTDCCTNLCKAGTCTQPGG